MAAIGTLPVLFATGIHASRPAASAVGKGGLYSCTTHSLVYQTDGSSWTTWASLSGTGLADPMTTRGDVIVRNSSNTTARLGVGAAGKFLTSDGTDVAYGQGPLTTTGDLLVGASGGTPTRLAAGSTSGHVLTSTGAGSAPSWQAAPGGASTGARYPVQEKTGTGASSGTHTATLSVTPTVGNLLIGVSVSEGAQDITSIVQTNVVWTLLAKSGAGVAPVVEVWKGVISSSAGTLVTANKSGSSSFGSLCVSEWSGLAGTLDTSATTHTTSGSFSQPIPIITPSVGTALVIGVLCQAGFGNSYVGDDWMGSPLTMFYANSTQSGSNVQGSFWGFPGATAVYGYGHNTNSQATQSALTVSII